MGVRRAVPHERSPRRLQQGAGRGAPHPRWSAAARPGRTTPAALLPALRTCPSIAVSWSLNRYALLALCWPRGFQGNLRVRVDLPCRAVSATLRRAALSVE